LRAALPGAEITLVAQPFAAGLAARCAYLDRFEAFPGYPGIAEQFFAPDAALRFFGEMQAREFDFGVQMHGSGVYANPFLLMMGAKTNAGFVRNGHSGGLDAPFRYEEHCHEVLRLLELVEFLGAPRQGESTEFALWPEDHEAAREALGGVLGPLIGVHPGAGDARKRWPLARFAEAARALQDRLGGTVVAIGGEAERAACDAIGGLNLAGLPIPAMGAAIARMSLLMTNDSGPAHIAYALGTPTVTLFGATSPEMWGPLDGSSHAVIAGDFEHLTAAEVVERAERLYAYAG
jgi:ADP-heptose:LPS heptosyltransferase